MTRARAVLCMLDLHTDATHTTPYARIKTAYNTTFSVSLEDQPVQFEWLLLLLLMFHRAESGRHICVTWGEGAVPNGTKRCSWVGRGNGRKRVRVERIVSGDASPEHFGLRLDVGEALTERMHGVFVRRNIIVPVKMTFFHMEDLVAAFDRDDQAVTVVGDAVVVHADTALVTAIDHQTKLEYVPVRERRNTRARCYSGVHEHYLVSGLVTPLAGNGTNRSQIGRESGWEELALLIKFGIH